jgi:hypothetical protein
VSRDETRTITEMVAERPDVDVTDVHAAYWDILSGVRDRILDRFDLAPHPSTADLASYTTGDFEGSLNTWTGDEVEWFVHSWIGNRKKSILDMNITVWLGPQVDVPHLVIVLGTVPRMYHYSELLARRDLPDHPDYVQRYYDPENDHVLSFWADQRFHWSVSHGTYMRAILTPASYSFMTEETEGIVDEFRRRVEERVDRWFAHVDNAAPVPVEEQAALRARDHRLRHNCYRLDPMNELAKNFMDPDHVERMVGLRMGAAQMAEVPA